MELFFFLSEKREIEEEGGGGKRRTGKAEGRGSERGRDSVATWRTSTTVSIFALCAHLLFFFSNTL
jgi:hypothetical protein